MFDELERGLVYFICYVFPYMDITHLLGEHNFSKSINKKPVYLCSNRSFLSNETLYFVTFWVKKRMM